MFIDGADMWKRVWNEICRTEDCPECGGTGRIHYEGLVPLECTGCNGTGIKGDPVKGAIVAIVISLVTTVPFLYWAF